LRFLISFFVMTTAIFFAVLISLATATDEANELIRIYTIGLSKAGKSSVANAAIRSLGGQESPFGESGSLSPGTSECSTYQIEDLEFVDCPGWNDAGGPEVDKQNMQSIRQFAESKKYFNALLFVVPDKFEHMDDTHVEAIKAYMKEFGGPGAMHHHLGFVYSKSYGTVQKKTSKLRTQYNANLLSQAFQHPIGQLPSWQVDCHPETWRPHERVTDADQIEQLIREHAASSQSNFSDMIQWIRGRSPREIQPKKKSEL